VGCYSEFLMRRGRTNGFISGSLTRNIPPYKGVDRKHTQSRTIEKFGLYNFFYYLGIIHLLGLYGIYLGIIHLLGLYGIYLGIIHLLGLYETYNILLFYYSNCGYQGEYEWYWFITDSKDESVGHSTYSMSSEEEHMGDTHTQVYYCPECKSEQ